VKESQASWDSGRRTTEAEDIVGIRCQATAIEDRADCEDLIMFCSELSSGLISESAIITFRLDLYVFNNPITNKNPLTIR
jgi:hypothetical protein